MSAAEQVVLYQELAAHDAPRLVLAFVALHHAASTLLAAGTRRAAAAPPARDPGRRDLGPGILRTGGGVRPGRAANDRAPGGRRLHRQRAEALGQRSGLRRLVPAAGPHRPDGTQTARDLLLPAGSCARPGIDVRPIRNAVGESHFCEIFLSRRDDPGQPAGRRGERRLAGGAADAQRRARPDHAGAGRTSRPGRLPLAARELPPALGSTDAVPSTTPSCRTGWPSWRRRSPACGRCAAAWWNDHAAGREQPADASIVKLYYSELLQRMMDFGTEIAGLQAHTVLPQTAVERLGVRRLGAGLHRLLGVDDPRRQQRDPAHHHRRARSRTAAGTDRSQLMDDLESSRRAAQRRPPAARRDTSPRLGPAGRRRLARSRGARALLGSGSHLRRGRRHPAGAGPGRGPQRLPGLRRARRSRPSSCSTPVRSATSCSPTVANGGARLAVALPTGDGPQTRRFGSSITGDGICVCRASRLRPRRGRSRSSSCCWPGISTGQPVLVRVDRDGDRAWR